MSQSHDSMIAVIAAHRDGKKIQRRATDNGVALSKVLKNHSALELSEVLTAGRMPESVMREWHDHDPAHPFNFSHWEYRIAPSPLKPREWWLIICPDGSPCSQCAAEPTLADAEAHLLGAHHDESKIVHVREVLPTSGDA